MSALWSMLNECEKNTQKVRDEINFALCNPLRDDANSESIAAAFERLEKLYAAMRQDAKGAT